MDKNEFINKINEDKSNNMSLLGKDYVSNIHEKIVNKVKGVNQNQQPGSGKADKIIQADIMLREAVKELSIGLFDLGDKEIAEKLLIEHILMLNELLKCFEKK